MESIIREMRYLNSKLTDRVVYLLKLVNCDTIFHDTMINYLRLVKSNRNSVKFTEYLMKIENHLLKKSQFNLVIHNIPQYGVISATNEIEQIGYTNMRDTLKQYGKVVLFEIVRGSVFVQFAKKTDALNMHTHINNMMMGENILHTLVI